MRRISPTSMAMKSANCDARSITHLCLVYFHYFPCLVFRAWGLYAAFSLSLSVLGSNFATFSFATRFATSQTTACITYGSSAFIFCGEWALPCVGIAVLPRCVRTMDFGCHWASASTARKSRIDCTYDASNHFGPRCFPLVCHLPLQATEIFLLAIVYSLVIRSKRSTNIPFAF
jgi:hypothetical protein